MANSYAIFPNQQQQQPPPSQQTISATAHSFSTVQPVVECTMEETDRMRGIHPEKWLQGFGVKSVEDMAEPCQQKVISSSNSVEGVVDMEQFQNLQSPCLPSTFDFDITDDPLFGTPASMDCTEIKSFTDMEAQYIDQERSSNRERESFQMIMEAFNHDPQLQQQPFQQQQQQQQHLHQEQQHMVQQMQQQQMQQQQQHQHQQQQQQQQQQQPSHHQHDVQQIVQYLQQPPPDQHQHLQQQHQLHQQISLLRHDQQQPNHPGATVPSPTGGTFNPVPIPRIEATLPGSTVPSPHGATFNGVTPIPAAVEANLTDRSGAIQTMSAVSSPNSPDSTTIQQQQQTAKPGPKRRSRGKKAKEKQTPPPVHTSCSKPPSGDLAPLPERHEMRIRVSYRTISAIDKQIVSPQGCIIFYNRPYDKEDLTGVEPVMLPPLPQTHEGITEKQWKYTNTVLNVLEKGVRLKVDPKGNIYAKRLCRSKVFWWNTVTPQDQSEEMKRDATVMVFNNELFEENMRQCIGRTGSNPHWTKPGVVLTFAQRWSKFDSHLNAHLVYATITPLKAVKLLEYMTEPRGERVNSIDTSLNTGDLALCSA